MPKNTSDPGSTSRNLRRDFLKTGALAGAVLACGVSPGCRSSVTDDDGGAAAPDGVGLKSRVTRSTASRGSWMGV